MLSGKKDEGTVKKDFHELTMMPQYQKKISTTVLDDLTSVQNFP